MQQKESISVRIIKVIYIILAVIFAVVIILINLGLGGMSKLKYSNIGNQVPIYKVTSSTFNLKESYSDAVLVDNNIQMQAEKIANEMSNFIKENYMINIDTPHFELYTSSNIKLAFSGITEESKIIICIPYHYISENDEKRLYSSIIHELFHAFSFMQGMEAYIYDEDGSLSILCEGFTDILTDEFIDYMSYDYNKRSESTAYKYYVYLLRCMFTQNMKQEYANFYFLGDRTIIDTFNNKVQKSANTSDLFNPYSRLEQCLNYIYDKSICGNDKTVECFYSSLELVLYCCSDGNEEEKQECKDNLKKIFDYAINVFIEDNKDKYLKDYEYFDGILT